jgi:hypothetical protein
MRQKARAFSVWLTLALAVLTMSVSARPASAQSTDLINYTNSYAVANGPQYPTRFTLSAPAAITQLITYHWNFGRGARPGFISLQHQSGQTFGPFAAIGTSGQNGAPNVNWIANVNITLPAGTYTVLDSDPSTWSHNAQSGFQGFFILRGTLLPPGLFPPFDTAGGNFQTARNLGVLSPGFPIQVNEWVGQTSSFWDTADFYSFTVPATGLTANPRNVTITTTGIGGDLSLFLYSLQPLTQLGYSFNLNSNNETIQVALYPGTYYVWVSPSTFGGPTAYTLRINT